MAWLLVFMRYGTGCHQEAIADSISTVAINLHSESNTPPFSVRACAVWGPAGEVFFYPLAVSLMRG